MRTRWNSRCAATPARRAALRRRMAITEATATRRARQPTLLKDRPTTIAVRPRSAGALTPTSKGQTTMVDQVSGTAGSDAATAAAASKNKLTTDKTQFLTLLTAQLKNQDPLSPMDSTEFTNQLVQYSAVEQQ